MLTSPFQQPSPRQNLLAGQIHEAIGLGDEHQLLLLQTQWVHRFGVETLPVDASQDVASRPQEQMAGHSAEADVTEVGQVEETFLATVEESFEEAGLSDQEQLHVAQLTQNVEPDNDSEPIDQQEESEAASPFERFTSLLSETVDERSEIEGKQDAQDGDAQDSDVQDSGSDPVKQPAPLAAVPVSAPPIRTPRSLRRWLPGGVDGLAEAS